jgi:hypothetical protein
MRRSVLLCALAISALAATAGSATTCNIDFIATISATAYDFALVLPSHETINNNYNGTGGTDDVFSTFGVSYPGTGTTLLHWTQPQTPIGNGTHIHVGWTTADNTCPSCINGYFTDQNCNEIPNTNVTVLVVDHVTGSTGFFENTCGVPITVTNVRAACLTTPLPLAELNSTNTTLGAELRSVSSGGTLQPGGQLTVPLPSGSSCNYVLNYSVTGQANAQISPWVELP